MEGNITSSYRRTGFISWEQLHRDARALVNIFMTEVSQDTWILFPWDSEIQFAQPIAGRQPRDC